VQAASYENTLRMNVAGRLKIICADAAAQTPCHEAAKVAMNEANKEHCGKCGAAIDPNRRVDYTLKDGTRVCESCFVKWTEKVAQQKRDWSN